MTRLSSMLVLATALAFVSASLPGASASVLPRQDESGSMLQAQQAPEYARVTRDEQQDPVQGSLTTRDEKEQTVADTSNEAEAADWWPCRWGYRYDYWSRRCVPDWGRSGPWYGGGRDDGFGRGGSGVGFSGPRKRDELVADEAQREDDWGPGGGWGGRPGGWGGGWGNGGWGGGGWGGRGGGWGRGRGGGWGSGRGWYRRDVDDEERGPGGGGRGGGGGGRGGGGRGGGGRGGGGGGRGYYKRNEIEDRDTDEQKLGQQS